LTGPTGRLAPDTLPDPVVLVLVGAAGSGKSTWAAARYRSAEIVSSDALRAVVGSGTADLTASADALRLLDDVVRVRIGRQLTTVVDTLGLDADRRRAVRALADAAGLPCIAVVFDTPEMVCRDRNRQRDRPVPADVLTGQLRRLRATRDELPSEGWTSVLTVHSTGLAPTQPAAATAERPAHSDRELAVRLQVSRFPWGADPTEWLVGVADAAREVGFEGLALMDHLLQIPQVDRAWAPIPAPWPALGVVAGRVPDLHLGTLVSPVTYHHPGVLAKTVATLDVLSGGRSFVGLGAGWWGREHAAFGVPFPAAAQRLDALERTIETMRALWGSGTKAYAGQFVQLPETTCYPRPIGTVPIVVGGAGERRTLAIAARLADESNLPTSAEDVVAAKLQVIARHCADAGRDLRDLRVSVLDVAVVGRDRDDVAARVERLRGRRRASDFARAVHAGAAADHVDRYRRLAELGVRAVYLALPDLTGPDDVERVAAVIQPFAGDAA
jgi:alkanesulfonate monooxygenase SsuD/methylene tetrahydromethanopterin reductase-like flavin-dependent oxidoreductase (luciferase family)/predicted kinase